MNYKVPGMKHVVIMFVFAMLFACNNKKNWQQTDSGLHYIIYDDKEGRKAQVGDGLQLHLIYKDGADSILFDSKMLGNAFIIELTEPPFNGSLEEGFAMLGEGDSAAFLVSADSVYKNVFHQALPKLMAAGTKLRIDVRLNKVLTPTEYKTYMRQQEQPLVVDETELIKKYLADNQLSAIPDSSGLYFISFVEGTGKQPQAGNPVEVSYLVRSLNGEVFDSSDKGYKAVIGDTAMVKGWNYGLLKMKEGGKARFILPSKLAYGEAGNGKIPERTPLVFDVDLIKVK